MFKVLPPYIYIKLKFKLQFAKGDKASAYWLVNA